MSTQTPGDKKNIQDLLKEKDAFLTTSEKCYEFFLRHTRGLIITGVVLGLVIVGIAIYINSQKKAEIQAVMAYETALSLIADHQQNLAVPIEALEKIRLDYKDRKVHRLAAFDLVGLYGAQGDFVRAQELAEELLQSLRQSEMSLKPLLLSSLGGLYEVGGDYIKADKSYQALLAIAVMEPQLKEDVLISLARVSVAAGQTEEALKYYQAVLTEFPQSYGAFWANYQMARLKGQAVAFPLAEVEAETASAAGLEEPLTIPGPEASDDPVATVAPLAEVEAGIDAAAGVEETPAPGLEVSGPAVTAQEQKDLPATPAPGLEVPGPAVTAQDQKDLLPATPAPGLEVSGSSVTAQEQKDLPATPAPQNSAGKPGESD